MRRATIREVADRAEVSIGTVSAVINGKGTVKESTRTRVRAAIEALSYRPVEAARRRLQTPKEKSIGFIIKELHNPYFADIIVGAQQAAEAHGYRVLAMSSEQRFELEREAVQALAAKDVEGIIINPLLTDEPDLGHLYALRERHIPFVLLEGMRGDIPASIVDVDNESAAREATDYLVSIGHREIAHLAGPRYSMHADERIDGVRSALISAGSFLRPENLLHVGAALEDGYRAGMERFAGQTNGELPTAVTCFNDLVAIGLLRALTELGLRVPEDVSVVGFDDINVSRFLTVPLTTVRMPRNEMGRQSAELLLRRMRQPITAPPERITLGTELVVRASTRPVPSPEFSRSKS